MKILLINTWIHDKNLNALLNYKNIELIIINNINEINNIDLNSINCIFSPSIPLNISLFDKYNIKFIFGPHFSVFPDLKINSIKSYNSIYVQPSEWAKNVWENFNSCKNLNLEVLPFGVDTEKYKDEKKIINRDKIFIYNKTRDPIELEYLKNFLKKKNIEYTIFSYDNKYTEYEYLTFLKNAKYGIWLGRHESQGFALQEALSCNIPLLVWNVKSINQEYRSNYPDYKATTIPYWDNRCGEYFYNKDDLEETYNLFISKLNNYKAREYILENLTYDICEKKLIDLINT